DWPSALSGGQQQMAALGRALMANPQLLLCDEISLSLAPIVVREIYAGGARRRYRDRCGRAGCGAGTRRRAARLLYPGRTRGAIRRGERLDARGNRRGLFWGVN